MTTLYKRPYILVCIPFQLHPIPYLIHDYIVLAAIHSSLYPLPTTSYPVTYPWRHCIGCRTFKSVSPSNYILSRTLSMTTLYRLPYILPCTPFQQHPIPYLIPDDIIDTVSSRQITNISCSIDRLILNYTLHWVFAEFYKWEVFKIKLNIIINQCFYQLLMFNFHFSTLIYKLSTVLLF